MECPIYIPNPDLESKMPAFQDLTGERFSRLEVLHKDRSTKGGTRWFCKCDCGNIKSILAPNLKSGDIKSCGCLNKEFEDFTNKVFGKLTAISRDYSENRIHWFCKCECGNIKSVGASDLKRGDTTSCGCYDKERRRKSKDLTGQKFGRLTVISRHMTESRGVFWNCICDCGKEKIVNSGHLKNGHTKSCGCIQDEIFKEIVTKHGLSGSYVYKLWCSVKERCFNKNVKQYKDYGGRGITLYFDWIESPVGFIEYVSKLENFGKDGYSLDRINNNGNYEPGNLRWATQATQCRNRRVSVINIEIAREIRALKGIKTIKEIAELFGIRRGIVYDVLTNKTWREEN